MSSTAKENKFVLEAVLDEIRDFFLKGMREPENQMQIRVKCADMAYKILTREESADEHVEIVFTDDYGTDE